jgi:hypothetical protein
MPESQGISMALAGIRSDFKLLTSQEKETMLTLLVLPKVWAAKTSVL